MPDPDIRDGELDQFSHALRELSDSLFGYTDSNGKEHTGAYDQAQAEYNKALAEYETTKAAYDKKRATQIPDDVHKGRAAYDDTELTEARKKMEKAKEAYDNLAAIRNETNNSERRKAGQAETYLLDFNYDNKYERTSAIASSGKTLPMMAPGTVDNVVMFGSPGSGVRNIDAYGLPEGHVYESSIPDGDAVQGLGPDASYGTNPRKLEGITHLSADATDAANYWTPTPPSIAGAAGVIERAIHGFDNHMAYFEEGTRTSQDFANIIAGAKPTTDEEWEALKKARSNPQPPTDDESQWWKQALTGY